MIRSIFISLFVSSIFFASCNEKQPISIDDKLKAVMQDFLYKEIKYDSSKVKYSVRNVIYFKDQGFYICDFTVDMKRTTGADTSGVMRARVSDDLKTVVRSY